ncbi:EamA family transporter [Desulfatitalea tepidiphila]|uniref:EamA family transporter n=1 Tax=Desulfatitalea tepidiphila TaxID=1185843 RepID=UPI00137924A2|nr:EamA family transporter [Desulfatitalea tepidiphila]
MPSSLSPEKLKRMISKYVIDSLAWEDSYGGAAVGYVTAIQMIGAAKTVLVTTTAPILVLPFWIIFLKERPGDTTVAGVLSCIVGICCVAL